MDRAAILEELKESLREVERSTPNPDIYDFVIDLLELIAALEEEYE